MEGKLKKKDILTNDSLFRTLKSYTPEEILAAGGTTAFGRRREKEKAEIMKRIENAPPIEPFTDEEWADLMTQLERDK